MKLSPMDPDQQKAIAVVESLRAGIPTRLSTRELPDLRSGLSQIIQKDLTQLSEGSPPQGRLIWGSYGQGKTHALTAIEHLALDQGFAVSRVALNREVSCHQLFNFYGRVAPLVRIPDFPNGGFLSVLSRKSPNLLDDILSALEDRYSHPLPALVLQNLLYASGEDQELLYGDLMGSRLTISEIRRIHRANHGVAMPRFSRGFKVSIDGTAYFGLLADAIRACGYKGWVILIDEVELMGRLGKVSRLKAYMNLHWLLNWSPRAPHTYPFYTVGVVASSLRNDLWFRGPGTLNPRAKCDQDGIPALAEEKLGAEAADEMKHFFNQAIAAHCPMLKPLGSEVQIELLQAISHIHGRALSWDPQVDIPALIRQLGDKPVRTAIRALLESLDIAYLYQESLSLKTAELRETSLEEDEGYFVDPSQDSLDPVD